MTKNIEKLLVASNVMHEQAKRIIDEIEVVKIWEDIDAQVNMVGSMAMDLMMKHRDIDFHIYTDPFCLADSFSAVAKLAEYPRIRSLTYTNLLDADDRCVEWHAQYQDDQNALWQIDMIHILKESPYVGYFERVAARINAVMTDEMRIAILAIKNAVPAGEKVMGIRIYRAVIEGGVREWTAFKEWDKLHPVSGIEEWMPKEKR